jgi:serine protease
MRRHLWIIALAALLALSAAACAQAQTGVAPARAFAPGQLVVKFDGQRVGGAIELPPGADVRSAAAALRRNPRVAYAEPNYLATTSALHSSDTSFFPNDSGTLGGAAEAAASVGGWSLKQWNFLPSEREAGSSIPTSPGGIDAVGAWQNLIAAGRPGARNIAVAVLDTGVAYRSYGHRFRGSPDFSPRQFLPGFDFVESGNLALDQNGHGTHVAGTIAENTGNALGLTGLAYKAKLIPIRVLDRNGRGTASNIARGIRFAIKRRARVINMSFNFDCGRRVPEVDEALREAYALGIVTVASVGNIGSEGCVSEPATGPGVIGVGASTEGGCLADYSLSGTAVDLLAPGGGESMGGCPSVLSGPIDQVTLKPGSTSLFGIPTDYIGTSMAAAHVSGVAAMVIASGVIGRKSSTQRVNAILRRLKRTARSLGLPRVQQGAGLIDAAAATEPIPSLGIASVP